VIEQAEHASPVVTPQADSIADIVLAGRQATEPERPTAATRPTDARGYSDTHAKRDSARRPTEGRLRLCPIGMICKIEGAAFTRIGHFHQRRSGAGLFEGVRDRQTPPAPQNIRSGPGRVRTAAGQRCRLVERTRPLIGTFPRVSTQAHAGCRLGFSGVDAGDLALSDRAPRMKPWNGWPASLPLI